jgi:hypothetical protein
MINYIRVLEVLRWNKWVLSRERTLRSDLTAAGIR